MLIFICVLAYGTGLIEHCCYLAGLTNVKRSGGGANSATGSQSSTSPEACCLDFSTKIATALREVLLQISEPKCLTDETSSSMCAVVLGTPSTTEPGKLSKYDSYYPLRFAQMASKPGVYFPSFNKAVDEFYSSLEIQRSEIQAVQSVRLRVYEFHIGLLFLGKKCQQEIGEY